MPTKAFAEIHVVPSSNVLNDNFLLCRTIGHGWIEVVRDDLERPDFGWRFSLQCERCKCERHDLIDPFSGDLIPGGRRYIHPEGYQLAEKFTRSEFRSEWARRRHYLNSSRKKSSRKR